MNEKKWFVLLNDHISGPFISTDVLNQIQQGHSFEARFWAKGYSNWMTLEQFNQALKKEQQEASVTKSNTSQWFYKEKNFDFGPFEFEELLSILKSKPEIHQIQIACGTKEQWKEIFQYKSFLEKLGISRRNHPRVPISGQLTIVGGFLRGQKANLTTLSEGGLGAERIQSISIGEHIKGTFSSPNLSLPIHFQGEVVFINSNRTEFALKFTNLSTEALSQIIGYVKKFVEEHPETDFRKIS